MKWIAAFAIVSVLGIAFSRAAEPTANPAAEFVRPFPIVAVAQDATEVQRTAARQIADAVGVPSVRVAQKNPVCCIWLEVTGWTPNPGEPGYFIINQGGGSLISASDEEQLKKAVEQFKKSIRNGANGAEVPVGMMTNYRIAALPGGR